MAERQRNKACCDPPTNFAGPRRRSCLAQVRDTPPKHRHLFNDDHNVALLRFSPCDDISLLLRFLFRYLVQMGQLGWLRGLQASPLLRQCYPTATVRDKIDRRRIKSLKSRPDPPELHSWVGRFSRGAGHASEYLFSIGDLRSSPLFVAPFGHHACEYGCLFGKPCRTKLDGSNNLR